MIRTPITPTTFNGMLIRVVVHGRCTPRTHGSVFGTPSHPLVRPSTRPPFRFSQNISIEYCPDKIFPDKLRQLFFCCYLLLLRPLSNPHLLLFSFFLCAFCRSVFPFMPARSCLPCRCRMGFYCYVVMCFWKWCGSVALGLACLSASRPNCPANFCAIGNNGWFGGGG